MDDGKHWYVLFKVDIEKAMKTSKFQVGFRKSSGGVTTRKGSIKPLFMMKFPRRENFLKVI